MTALTALRTAEAIGATWGEIDLRAKLWTVPAERMKARREHRVPLADRVIEILRGLPRGADAAPVFADLTGKPLRQHAMLDLMQRAYGRGFRRTGCAAVSATGAARRRIFRTTSRDGAGAYGRQRG